MSKCIVVVKHSQFVLPQRFLHTEANAAGSFVDLLIDHLVLWQELNIDNASHIKECDQYDFDCLALFGFSNVSDFH